MQFYKLKPAIPDSLLTFCRSRIMSHTFPWFFRPNRKTGIIEQQQNEREFNHSFFHPVYSNEQIHSSEIFDLTNSVALSVQSAINEEFDLLHHYEITRMRWTMTVNTSHDARNEEPHRDIDYPHKVILFYLNDSDGDTLLYDNIDHGMIIDSNSPEENTAIFFDGANYHSGTKPMEYARRIVLNINLMKYEEIV